MPWSVELIDPADLPHVWPCVSEWYETAVESSRGKMAMEDFVAAFATRHMHLWLVRRDDEVVGSLATEFAQFPRRRVCRIAVCVGDGLPDWIHLIADIEAWAGSMGSAGMHLIARKGYARALVPFGYEQTHVVLEKDLNG